MGLNIPQLPELTFEEDSHTYRLDGLIIPSVTTLMKPLSEAYYGGIDAKVLGKAADRGSAVHSAIDLYSKYGVIDIEPELEGYFEAFRAWAKDFEVKPYATETRTYNRSLLYAGTVDILLAPKFRWHPHEGAGGHGQLHGAYGGQQGHPHLGQPPYHPVLFRRNPELPRRPQAGL